MKVGKTRKPTRPHVAINMAMSADGKITTFRRERFSLGSPADRRLMDVLRADSDAVIIGARTLRLDGWPIRVRDPRIRRSRVRSGRPPHPLNVVLTTRLDVPEDARLLNDPETEKLLVTTRLAPRARVERFRRLAEVHVLPAKRIRPVRVLDLLARRGVRRVVVEGGGELNFSFFRGGLVNEIYITVTPRIIGGASAPTPVDGEGFLRATHVRLELVSARRKGEEVFLRYRVNA